MCIRDRFLTAFSGADGYLQSVVTDEGETLPVVEDKTKTVSYTHLVLVVAHHLRNGEHYGLVFCFVTAAGNPFSYTHLVASSTSSWDRNSKQWTIDN